MAAKTELTPVIIKKKRAGKHGHHGGAWKVAYADFVTAMMALFIVLWLMSSSENVKKAIAGYFRDPTGAGSSMGSGQAGSGEGLELQKKDLEHLKDKLESAFRQLPNFQQMLKDKIQMVVTGEGLRIEFMETEQGLFFETGSAIPTAQGTELLSSLAREVGQMKNDLLIEGHTDSRAFARGTNYGNWELSTDRSNAARRILQRSGLREGQVAQVRGYADQKLRDKADPNNASNRRISIVVRYNEGEAPGAAAKALEKTPGAHGGH
jgi:chemotaxis protein MotB